jgi:poly-beta-1,6-N-acetyl-D-glucosamine synthase
MAKLLFWISVGLTVYVYIGYPLLLWAMQAIFSSPSRKAPIEPTVSLLIAAYNEAKVISQKIRNSLELDYPEQKLEIVVASDGSTDATADIVRSFAASRTKRVRLLNFEKNRGKMQVLNDAMPQMQGEVVAFSDASSMLARNSLRILVQSFSDSRVGAVSGVYRLLKKDEARIGSQEDFYWKYETFLKVQEAKLGAFTGAHGSLYAIRRELYPFPDAGTINDDFTIPMRILERGHRVAYEPAAVAYEEAHEMEGFSRRVRITAGNVEQLREIKGLLWPPRPLALFCLISHKTGRLVVPVLLIVALISNILLIRRSPYDWLFLAQVMFYGLAALGTVANLKPKFLRLPFYFCMINLSLFAWIYHALRHGRAIPSRIELDQFGNRPSTG